MYSWDLCTNRFQTIGCFFRVAYWHLHVDDDVLVMFEIDGDQSMPEVQQTKWSLTCGEQLDEKRYCLSVVGPRVDEKISLSVIQRLVLHPWL